MQSMDSQIAMELVTTRSAHCGIKNVGSITSVFRPTVANQ